jgi:WD40 repeat protein
MLHPIHRLRTLCLLGLCLSWVCQAARAQQPDESQLPATSPPAAVPDEGQLPAQTAAPSDLPSEAALPGVAPAAGDAVEESSLSPGSLRPWLRLRFDGHTGSIRTLDRSLDGKFLVSAGEDKDVHVWSRQDTKDLSRTWFHRRTIRWQVDRGPRGRIYAAAMQGNLVAFAGNGAMGSAGEIWIVDMTTGNLVQSLSEPLRGHRSVIQSLAWRPQALNPNDASGKDAGSSGGQVSNSLALASADLEGRLLLWSPDPNTGIWSPRIVVGSDVETYGTLIGPTLAPSRRFVPLTFLGPDNLVFPHYVGTVAKEPNTRRWHLQRYNVLDGKSDLIEANHIDMVTTMTASQDGRRLATADFNGSIITYSFDTPSSQPSVQRLDEKQRTALSLDFNDDTSRLLVGGVVLADTPFGSLQWYSTTDANSPPQLMSITSLLDAVWGCEFDTQTSHAIVALGNRIQTRPLINDQIGNVVTQTMAANVGAVTGVAFAKQSPPYKLLVNEVVASNPETRTSHLFDLTDIRLDPNPAPTEGEAARTLWVNPLESQGPWSYTTVREQGVVSMYVLQNGVRRGKLPLLGEKHGTGTCIAWFKELPAAEGDAPAASRTAFALGTNGRGNIYIYEASDAAEPKLLRQFRGHTGAVLSVGASSDQRYLVSGSDDATACIWKLEDIFSADELTNRWGATFEIQGDRLFAANVRKDGPLYFRGVRSGDQLVNLSWTTDTETRSESNADELLKALAEVDFDLLVKFTFARLGRPYEFQSFPAWQPVATLFIDQTREWAIWTPAGFYDASFGGNELFGWQINRGVSSLPDYFRAAQFRQRLEKPEAMRKLFKTGDLSTAMEDSLSGIAPPPGEGAIVNQVLSKPEIRILKPLPDQLVTAGTVEVEAEIRVPRGARLELPKAFASGVPAIGRTLVRRQEDGDKESYLYRWTARLPRDPRVPLEIIAATDAGATDRRSIELDNQSKPPARAPRMYFLSLGVSDYSDPQIQKLDFAAIGASTMASLFRERTIGLYRTKTSELLDRDAIRPLWRDYAAQAARELSADVGPDDLIVMYLCGHGIRDRRTNQWYFVTADARYNDLMNDRYEDLLSFDDLAMLGSLPCRKLAIIDSCHSGAVQPVMRNDDLKAAMRMLQGDVVLTMTASEGEEEAAEQKDRQLGRFTSHLVDALHGVADRDQDGIVTLHETIDHVVAASAEDARKSGFVQHPTAGPADLLKTLNLPLTRTP